MLSDNFAPFHAGLSPQEASTLFRNPYVLAQLINQLDCWESEDAAVREPEDGPCHYFKDRKAYLKSVGKAIVEEDVEIWEPEILEAFGVLASPLYMEMNRRRNQAEPLLDFIFKASQCDGKHGKGLVIGDKDKAKVAMRIWCTPEEARDLVLEAWRKS